MFVRTVDELAGTPRDRNLGGGRVRSVCLLAQEDGCGFSFSEVTVVAGEGGAPLHYRNHVEANFVTEGEAIVEDLSSGERHAIGPLTLYVVGPADRHTVTVAAPMRLFSVFVPAIVGTERHDDEGAYPPSGDIPEGWGPPGGDAGSRRMFVRTPAEVETLTVAHGEATTARYLNRDDGCGITLSDVHLRAGNRIDLWYKNHVEANFVVGGSGTVSDLTTGESWPLENGTLYVVGPKDRHRMEAATDLHVISVFNPPLTGRESHDDDGSYPPTGEIPPAWRA